MAVRLLGVAADATGAADGCGHDSLFIPGAPILKRPAPLFLEPLVHMALVRGVASSLRLGAEGLLPEVLQAGEGRGGELRVAERRWVGRREVLCGLLWW
jgi:hypothetical protein